MREAVVVASSRTGLAKSVRGSFNITRPEDLAAHCIRDVLRKVPQLDAADIDDIVLGCAQPHGPQSHNIARTSAMLAGLPASVAGTTVNRFCSSGLQPRVNRNFNNLQDAGGYLKPCKQRSGSLIGQLMDRASFGQLSRSEVDLTTQSVVPM
jgi:Thiolase, N-terminal domain